MFFLSETTTRTVIASDMAQSHVAWEFSRFSVGIDCWRCGAGPWILQFGLEQSQEVWRLVLGCGIVWVSVLDVEFRRRLGWWSG